MRILNSVIGKSYSSRPLSSLSGPGPPSLWPFVAHEYSVVVPSPPVPPLATFLVSPSPSFASPSRPFAPLSPSFVKLSASLSTLAA